MHGSGPVFCAEFFGKTSSNSAKVLAFFFFKYTEQLSVIFFQPGRSLFPDSKGLLSNLLPAGSLAG